MTSLIFFGLIEPPPELMAIFFVLIVVGVIVGGCWEAWELFENWRKKK
jgi:hypothetical protein